MADEPKLQLDETRILGGTLKFYPGVVPSTPIVWPTVSDQHTANKIQQTKGTAKAQGTFIAPTTQPSVPSVPPRTTPQKVSGVRIVQRRSGGNKIVTVQFIHPHNDPFFTGANVYLKPSGKQPVQVAGGAKSPLTFTVPVNNAPHSIYVTSSGNWGETDVLSSPSAPLRLT